MKMIVAMVAFALANLAHAQQTDKPIVCTNCVEWNQPQKPFRVVGNTYYVGTSELSSVLVTGPQGHILLDGALPQSAAIIAANIKALGFRITDVKLILNSHAHFDHAGGIAALQRLSGAVVVAGADGAKVLEAGTLAPDDPQFEPVDHYQFPKVSNVRSVADGETVTVGPLSIKAHATPGHTLGGTTWTWRSCERGQCHDVVYADSLNPFSTDGFLYTRDGKQQDRSAQFQASIDKVAALKCDVIIAGHPGLTDLMEAQAKRKGKSNPFIDRGACKTYAAEAAKRLAARLAKER